MVLISISFNTSHVVVYQFFTPDGEQFCHGFNTSHVVVYQKGKGGTINL